MPDKNMLDSLKTEERIKQIDLKKQAQTLQEEQRKKNAKVDPNDPKSKTYWEVVDDKAEQLVDKNFSGFNDWAIGMMDIFHACMHLNKALAYDPPHFTNFIPGKDLLGAAYDVTIGSLGDNIAKSRMSEKDLPVLRCTADVDEEGHFSSLMTKNGRPISQEQQAHFDTGIAGWAVSQGYKLKEMSDHHDPKVKFRAFIKDDGHGEIMTRDEFQKLSQDKDTGLNKFLSGEFQMKAGFNPSPLSTVPRP